MENLWSPVGPSQYVARRSALKRTGFVTYAVRAHRGVIVRRGEDGKPEYDRCPHAHSKPRAARECAEKEARRRNRQIKKETA